MEHKFTNVDEYISSFPSETASLLQRVRETILSTAREAEEVISYNMPAYKLNGMLVYFASYKKHIGLYALPSGNKAFQEELSVYKQGKGSIQFPLDKPIPFELIKKIVQFRIKENLEKKKG